MSARRLCAAFIIATATWACALVLAPFLATRAHASAFGTAFVAAVYAVGSIVCHQLPERSFHLWSVQMPVCARCTGIYVAAAASAPVALRCAATVRRSRANRVMLALALVPSSMTLVYEWTTGVAPANWIRFLAGVPIGAAVAWLLVAAGRNQVN